MKRRLYRMALAGMAVLIAAALPGSRGVRAVNPYLRVKPGGMKSGKCDSWAHACDLQYALGGWGTGNEFWLKKGVYKPTNKADWSISFVIPPGVTVLGGFAGTEISSAARNWKLNKTILSGDIDNNDVNLDGNFIAETWKDIKGNNSTHVVEISGQVEPVHADTVLDGLTITAGKASLGNFGAGLVCRGGGFGHECSPTLMNMVFSGNMADRGGALFNDGAYAGISSPVLSNVIFRGNRVTSYGGAMYNAGSNSGTSNPSLTNVTFSGNRASSGGAMYNAGYDNGTCNPQLINVTFSRNRAVDGGGALYNNAQYSGTCNPFLDNVTFRGNRANVGGAIYSFGTDGGDSTPNIFNATFSANQAASSGGALLNDGRDGNSTPSLTNVILWGNTAPVTGPQIANLNALPVINYSILQAGNGGIGGDSGLTAFSDGTGNLDANPLLNSLANNGGLTKTMTLKMGSPAVDAGTNLGCTVYDQRMLARPQGTKCDIGAVEARYNTFAFLSQPANDGWVRESAMDSGVGGARNSTATAFMIGDDVDERQYRAILSFNTASLPDEAVIPVATLKCKSAGMSAINPFDTLGGSMTLDVRKGAFGLAALQNSDFQAAPHAYNAAVITEALYDGWYVAAINAEGRAQVNTTGITQFRTYFPIAHSENDQAEFIMCSSGNAPEEDQPYLEVTFITP